ncbi:MAG: hypothetical protein HYX68_09495 [Planctomycetes bacterium]|nr:hypothetical protein [Planctomycetota bacterium]
MKRVLNSVAAIWCWLGAASFAAAQTAPAYPSDLLALLPDDFAVCIVMHDLRGHSARWEKSDWLKAFRQSSVGKSIFGSPEMEQFTRWQADMKKHLDLDWPTLRDEILGDTFVMAYTPGPKDRPGDEHGLFLLQVRKPERLAKFIDKFNDVQTRSGELKSLTKMTWKNTTYFRRDQEKKTQFYVVKDSLVAITTKEDVIKNLIQGLPDRSADNLWAKRFQRAGAESAFLTMCVNPRILAPEVVRVGKKGDALPGYWRALDAIFVTLSIRQNADLRITIQADAARLPVWARPAFTDTLPMSDLWQRFPEKGLLTIAGKTDFAGTAEALKMLMPEKDRTKLAKDWASIGAVLDLDLLKDILPNVGPDWGLCILPARNAQQLPEAILAIAVKPGNKEKPIDQTLIKGIDFFAKFAVLQNPNDLRLQTVKQGKIEVRYLASTKLFPPGFQPACALKDGFLLVATSPAAIADFGSPRLKVVDAKEALLLRLSAPELGKLLNQRRDHILATLTTQQQMPAQQAKKNLDNVISLLGSFDRLTLSHQGGAGQASWIIRLTPAPGQ